MSENKRNCLIYTPPHHIGRQESIRFKVMPSGNIRAWQFGTQDKRGVSEWQITNPKNASTTITTAHQGGWIMIPRETE